MGRVVRSAALVLVAFAAGTGAWACGRTDTAATAGADVDPGPTYGVEITVAIKGRGRVVSDPPALDCPANCFARIVLDNPTFDGSDKGLALTASATVGAHFVGWTYEAVDVGVRARGPSECSPMMRSSTVLPITGTSTRLDVHYGETQGTPPAGHEAACADFRTVPVAYALTATFEESSVGPGPGPQPGPPVEVLFEPPTLGVVVAREIGITGGRLYWRFDRAGASGVASGQPDGKGGGSIVVVQPFDPIRRFHVGRHVVMQHGSEQSSGYIDIILSGTTTERYIGFMSYQCGSLTSDDTTAYCRAFTADGAVTYLFALPFAGGGPTYLYTLPPGNAQADLAVNDQGFYFSEDRGEDLQGRSLIESAPPFPDGGTSTTPIVTKLVFGLTKPKGLTIGPTNFFWLDDQAENFTVASSAPLTGADAGLNRAVPGGRFIATDPTSPTTFWIALSPSNAKGDAYIVKASALSTQLTPFRSGLTGIGGITADATHVYWTQNDGRVYRAPKE
jgi:hypothetical protein